MKISRLMLCASGLGMLGGILADYFVVGKKQKEQFEVLKDNDIKFREFYDILLQWLNLRQKGGSVVSFFKKNQYHTVAIYGMKELGIALADELCSSDIEVKYCIDKNAQNIEADIKVVSPEDNLETVDVIVVTAVHHFTSILLSLKEKVSCPIVALDDVIYESMNI